jgi:hypothetical protein
MPVSIVVEAADQGRMVEQRFVQDTVGAQDAGGDGEFVRAPVLVPAGGHDVGRDARGGPCEPLCTHGGVDAFAYASQKGVGHADDREVRQAGGDEGDNLCGVWFAVLVDSGAQQGGALLGVHDGLLVVCFR